MLVEDVMEVLTLLLLELLIKKIVFIWGHEHNGMTSGQLTKWSLLLF
jgi:hypothetical protein